VRKSGGFRGSGAGVVVGVRAEALAECGRLCLQGVSLRARLGQGVSGGAHSFLGGGGILEKGRILLELVGAGGVGFPGGRGLALQALGGSEGLIAQLGGGGGRGARGRAGGHGSETSAKDGDARARSGRRARASKRGVRKQRR
jgi:hypothetical protein